MDQNLFHIKLINGDDILAYIRPVHGEFTELYTPVAVYIDPTFGIFAKSWLLLSDSNSVMIKNSHILFASKASNKAVEYYDEFMHRLHEKAEIKKMEEDSEFTSELEDIFTAIAESKSATKN